GHDAGPGGDQPQGLPGPRRVGGAIHPVETTIDLRHLLLAEVGVLAEPDARVGPGTADLEPKPTARRAAGPRDQLVTVDEAPVIDVRRFEVGRSRQLGDGRDLHQTDRGTHLRPGPDPWAPPPTQHDRDLS